MKKLVLSLLAVSALAFSTQAQTEKGKFMIGGNVEFNSEKAEGADKADINLSLVPSVGYFIGNNIAIGTGVGYELSKVHSASATAIGKSQAFVVAPFARYYAGTEQFKFFGQLSVPMAFGNVKNSIDGGESYRKQGSISTVGVALSPGVAFFPSKKFGIEFSVNGISYNDNRIENNNGDRIAGSSKNFNVGANFFSPKIGVQFYL
ncbi:outer membrane beta-barrel protein [Pedobacter sp. AW31-3R]|uniref:outer membrane beta-barrel protein n=1 Tax=Pedobacter sp. AW31-3R TaxID=3445781 RepID=UPI003FA0C104